MINLILTVDQNNVVAMDNTLPWMIPSIMQEIKDEVKGHEVVLGSKTFEFMGGTKFPGATKTYVLTRKVKTPRIKDVSFIKSTSDIPHKGKKEIYVLGGIDTFHTFKPLVNNKTIVYILNESYEGNRIFNIDDINFDNTRIIEVLDMVKNKMIGGFRCEALGNL